jgi:hypothetical protein
MGTGKKLFRETSMAALFALAGWTIAAAVESVAYWSGSLHTAFAVHAVASVVIFALVAFVYFRRPEALPPATTAALFALITLGLDLLAGSVFTGRGYDPARSLQGTWLPAALVLLTMWILGIGAGEPAERGPRKVAF